ncbi:MAG TPA: YtxH domain-containing protein [Bacteroidales bacterium]
MISGKVILGALAGITAGALFGILFAPDKGSKSRNKIVKKGEDYLDTVKEKFNTLLDTVAGKFDGGRIDISDIGKNGKTKSKDAKRDMQPSVG